MRFGAWGVGFVVLALRFGVWCLVFKVWDFGCRVGSPRQRAGSCVLFRSSPASGVKAEVAVCGFRGCGAENSLYLDRCCFVDVSELSVWESGNAK